MNKIVTWKRNRELISGQEYIGNQLVAKYVSKKGYNTIIDEYVYIDSNHIEKTFNLIPEIKKFIHGVGVDLGGE